MNLLTPATLVLRNRVRHEGRGQFLGRIAVLSLLNVLLLGALFTTASGASFELGMLAEQYGYFVPLLTLMAAVGTWEIELWAGVGESYLRNPTWVWPTRLLLTLVEVAVPFVFFVVTLLAVGGPDVLAHLVTATGMLLAFSLLGAALGFCVGFRHEKSVNNFLSLAPWLLGFGPGPFFGNDASGLGLLFPGGFSARGDFVLEWLRLAAVAVLAYALYRWGSRARRHRFFTR
ncbi:hypothetical protein E0L36_23300 [Streptomyces sp. AJS327]|uniref:hypothetical protein n=1 Tax=Streptomyces sp. AJS327 TaxID=2545265 RepID=UPI0015DF931A|nr:hypothetical protein [Streptomyces sp. AJS327]MBA0053683.1 hypothetical protein [Streptomyces sp. AJS327]